MRRQRKFLVDHGHAGPAGFEGIARPVRLAVQPHLARIRFDRSRADLHQRAFARPILTHQREHLACGDLDAHIFQRNCCPEALGNSLHLEPGRSGRIAGL